MPRCAVSQYMHFFLTALLLREAICYKQQQQQQQKECLLAHWVFNSLIEPASWKLQSLFIISMCTLNSFLKEIWMCEIIGKQFWHVISCVIMALCWDTLQCTLFFHCVCVCSSKFMKTTHFTWSLTFYLTFKYLFIYLLV